MRLASMRLVTCTPIEQQSWQVPMPVATLGRRLAADGLADSEHKGVCNLCVLEMQQLTTQLM